MQKIIMNQIKNKVEKVIDSCITFEQLQVAKNYLNLFNKKYNDISFYLDMVLRINKLEIKIK
jgi:hypothetical protein